MTRSVVHLVRHGEVYNPMKLLYGRLPGFHLSARGRSMAAVTAQYFAGRDVAYLASSPLERAQETAAPIAEVTGCEVDTLGDLIESANVFEGLRTKGLRSQLWYPPRWRHMTNPLEPSWSESYEEIFERMWRAVGHARTQAQGHEAVVVSHQLPIVMVQRHAQGKRMPHVRRKCDLASVTSLVFEGPDVVDFSYREPAKDV
ncbi:histidine phosphatase family protein [Corynebacterium liangguodongii]|uniref:Uncharacterized protein n=1 Tax=Corynebacterium liangguodongii TaxID=2079535 RepID=A0A2S0WC08_9CORY|nr:histidine phosphatase family protein [Corynebacterium liangguodongii]AWB83296.1 hypothetical protein C3E79_01350 [Corynebacterium liangguodongii]PWC00614.1 histidine phosphatase family protein [Corynebacterium liangguodongii]